MIEPKIAKLIDFTVEEVPVYGDSIVYYDKVEKEYVSIHEVYEDETIQKRVIPVITLCNKGAEDVYLAYTQQAEELLGIPISAILSEKQALSSLLEEERREYRKLWKSFCKYKHVSFLERLKFLFKGEL